MRFFSTVAIVAVLLSFHASSVQAASALCCGPIRSPGVDLQFVDASPVDFGYVAVGDVGFSTITIRNLGGREATDLLSYGESEVFAFRGDAFPGTGGTCGAKLGSLQSCTVVIQFAPTNRDEFQDEFVLSYQNERSSIDEIQTRLVGESRGLAHLQISDRPVFDFGTVQVGSTTEKVFTVTNTGNSAATFLPGSDLTEPYFYKLGAFPGYGGTCVKSLDPGASCTVVTIYSPSTQGDSSDNVVIEFNNGESEEKIALLLRGKALQ